MLRFICDNIVKGIDTDTWYNEMMSLLAEDIFSGYLGLDIKSTAIERLYLFKILTNFVYMIPLFFLSLYLRHMDVPRRGIKLEL